MEEINERFEKLGDIENYKQLNEDLESGKTFLIDYINNRIEVNQFGIPIIKYYREITGQKPYKYRATTLPPKLSSFSGFLNVS